MTAGSIGNLTSGSGSGSGASPLMSQSPSAQNLNEKVGRPGTAGSGGVPTISVSAAEKAEDGSGAGAGAGDATAVTHSREAPQKRSFLFGWRVTGSSNKAGEQGKSGDIENVGPEPRPIRLFAPIYGGLGAALSIFFIGSGVSEYLFCFLRERGRRDEGC